MPQGVRSADCRLIKLSQCPRIFGQSLPATTTRLRRWPIVRGTRHAPLSVSSDNLEKVRRVTRRKSSPHRRKGVFAPTCRGTHSVTRESQPHEPSAHTTVCSRPQLKTIKSTADWESSRRLVCGIGHSPYWQKRPLALARQNRSHLRLMADSPRILPVKRDCVFSCNPTSYVKLCPTREILYALGFPPVRTRIHESAIAYKLSTHCSAL
jgi:hypothetical protein